MKSKYSTKQLNNFSSTQINTTGVLSSCQISYNNELLELEKRQKELKVLSVHKNKISSPTNKCKTYRTRATWVPSGRISNVDYDQLIENLYNHYFPTKNIVPTFRECFDDWVNRREANGSIEHLTAQHYRCDYAKYIAGHPIETLKVDKVSKRLVIDYFEQLVGDGSAITSKAFTGVKSIFNGVMNNANLQDGVECINISKLNLHDLQSRCKQVDNSDDVYSEEEIKCLLQYLQSLSPSVYSLAVQLICCLSIRIGELTAIRWSDIDFENRTIVLSHTMVTKKVGNVSRKRVDVAYMKKHSTAGKRTLYISDYALSVLGELKKLNGDKQYVLQSEGNLPIATNAFNAHLKSYCNEAGITYRSSHKIRFYACSKMYEAGLDERTIQTLMGHSSIEMTRHYDRRKKKILSDTQINMVFGYELPSDA